MEGFASHFRECCFVHFNEEHVQCCKTQCQRDRGMCFITSSLGFYTHAYYISSQSNCQTISLCKNVSLLLVNILFFYITIFIFILHLLLFRWCIKNLDYKNNPRHHLQGYRFRIDHMQPSQVFICCSTN